MGGCCSTNQGKQEPKSPRQTKPRQPSGFTPAAFVRSYTHNWTDDYDVMGKLGENESGRVVLATHKESGLRYAVKSIPVSRNTDTQSILNGIEIGKHLDHPNIVRTHAIYVTSHSIQVVMEYCQGGQLFDRIVDNSTPLTEKRAAKWMLELISALLYLRNESIVHRDLKPENLLLESNDEDARIKVTSFMFSTRIGANEQLNKGVGTSYYMAPEVLSGSYDSRCDIWSAGIILYILLSGRPPFNGDTDGEICKNVLTEELNFKRKVWNSVSEQAKNLLRKMLAKKPDERPSLEEILADPWIRDYEQGRAPNTQLATAALHNLATFQSQNRLLQASLSFISSRLLSQEEVAALADVFEEIDTDHNGLLTTEEIKAAFATIGTSNLPMKKLFAAADIDGDGVIEYSEFLTAALKWSDKLNRNRLYQAFKQYDVNGDGKLSLEELAARLGTSGSLLVSTIREADVDGDGTIDFDEFCEFICRKVGSPLK